MAKYRNNLPQFSGNPFLTDGGLETTMIFQKGIELPEFAAINLLRHREGLEALREYFRAYAAIARQQEVGFILESATWRASPDWGARLDISPDELEKLNRISIDLLEEMREEFETPKSKMVISGCIGPRGDGYNPAFQMSAKEAEEYHGFQAGIFKDTQADMISALTMNYIDEAIGVARAAKAAGMPAVIAFTVETDGSLPTGESLKEAITSTDEATESAPAYYMVNCAHPTHFDGALLAGEEWLKRVRGVRPNSSTKSHAELDNSTELDEGNPAELGEQCRALRMRLPNMNVFGGCCGTDHRHIEAISNSCMPLFRS